MSDHKHGEMNIEAQEHAFAGFIKFSKWGIIISLGVLIFLALVNA